MRHGLKSVFWAFSKDGDGVGVLREREAIVAIEMGMNFKSSLLFPQFCVFELGSLWVVILLEGEESGREWRTLWEMNDIVGVG